MKKEVWKKLKFVHKKYYVSNFGRVKNIKYYKNGEPTIMKTILNNCGYEKVRFRIDGKNKEYSIHRLVAIAFIPNPENKPEVNHKNGVKTDNRVDNLEWNTRSENRLHCVDVLGKNKGKEVNQYSLDGKFIKTWLSSRIIENELGFKKDYIRGCCRGKQKTSYGFIWEYKK